METIKVETDLVKEDPIKSTKIKEQKPDIPIDLLLAKSWKVNPVKQNDKGDSVLEVANGKTKLYILTQQNKAKSGRVSIKLKLYGNAEKALAKLD